jgi:hypothetical protein
MYHEVSYYTRGRGRPRKTTRETIKKELEINEWDRNMVFDRYYDIVRSM